MSGSVVDFSVLDGVQEGDELIVRFLPRATHDLVDIIGMVSVGVLTVGPIELALINEFSRERDWQGDGNRTQTFTVGPHWVRSVFEGRMRRALESLRVNRKR